MWHRVPSVDFCAPHSRTFQNETTSGCSPERGCVTRHIDFPLQPGELACGAFGSGGGKGLGCPHHRSFSVPQIPSLPCLLSQLRLPAPPAPSPSRRLSLSLCVLVSLSPVPSAPLTSCVVGLPCYPAVPPVTLPLSFSHYSLRPRRLCPARLLCRWNSPDKDTGVACHSLLQGNLADPGTKPASPALADGFFTAEPPGKPPCH